MVTCVRAMGNSKGIVKRLGVETTDAAKIPYNDELGIDRKELCSTTIPWIVYNFKQSTGVGPQANGGR